MGVLLPDEKPAELVVVGCWELLLHFVEEFLLLVSEFGKTKVIFVVTGVVFD